MKNKEFFYLQYDKVDWKNQEETKLNYSVNNFIIENIISKKDGDTVKIFDIGFGVGFFFRMLEDILPNYFKDITLAGCEPSEKNYKHFESKPIADKIILEILNKAFLDADLSKKFDFITSIYSFTNFLTDDLENAVRKIHSMLNNDGKFILVVANQEYLENKLETKKDLFIEKNRIELDGKKYDEELHYSEIPEIGTIIDYNREENFYIDLFRKNNFDLEMKDDFKDSGFVSTVYVFSRK